MSDEPSSSTPSAAIASSSQQDTQDGSPLPAERTQDAPPTSDPKAQLAERRKKNREMFNRKSAELLDDVIRNVDILVYAELSAIYYMDCLFLRFILRAMVQFVFLTPKPPNFPDPPQNRPYVGAMFGTSILCLLLVFLVGAPSGNEASRGYVNGGIVIDFIGQSGSTSVFVLAGLDLLVLVLQAIQLSAVIAKQRLKQRSSNSSSTASQGVAPSDDQDLDSEERGIRRSEELQQRNVDVGVELQNLDEAGRATTSQTRQNDDSSEREALLASTAAGSVTAKTDAQIFDAFHSGQVVIADLQVWKTVKEQFWAYQKSSPESRVSDLSTSLARGGLGSRLLRAGRTLDV